LIKVGVIFGTRPEVIKLAPVILEMKKYPKRIMPVVITTSQHREILKQPLELFDITPDFDLDIMKSDQNLFDVSTKILTGIKNILYQTSPDIILVQGDTSTTFLSALAAFYLKIKIGHVEAGLRTQNRYNPFPEEMNRRLVGTLANYHFAPTDLSKGNLLKEGIDENRILITGNTSIDAIQWVIDNIIPNTCCHLDSRFPWLNSQGKHLLVTTHRRESFGDPIWQIMLALKSILIRHPDVNITFPVHPNPNVRKVVYEHLNGIDRAHLIDPVRYDEFIYLMKRSHFILTDSGGIQEEAPYLGKPVLVLRDTTERPEAVAIGANHVVGTNHDDIVQATENLLDCCFKTKDGKGNRTPFGDGTGSTIIVNWLLQNFQPTPLIDLSIAN